MNTRCPVGARLASSMAAYINDVRDCAWKMGRSRRPEEMVGELVRRKELLANAKALAESHRGDCARCADAS